MNPWNHYRIPLHVLRETERALLSFHTSDSLNEGVVYWGGRQTGDSTIVTSAFIPEAEALPGSVETNHEANAHFVDWLHDHALIQVGHVHTHPPGIRSHSKGDDDWIFGKTPHLLSLVVRNYGLDGIRPVEDHGWHICEGNDFRLFSDEEVRDRVHILPDATDHRRTG